MKLDSSIIGKCYQIILCKLFSLCSDDLQSYIIIGKTKNIKSEEKQKKEKKEHYHIQCINRSGTNRSRTQKNKTKMYKLI